MEAAPTGVPSALIAHRHLDRLRLVVVVILRDDARLEPRFARLEFVCERLLQDDCSVSTIARVTP